MWLLTNLEQELFQWPSFPSLLTDAVHPAICFQKIWLEQLRHLFGISKSSDLKKFVTFGSILIKKLTMNDTLSSYFQKGWKIHLSNIPPSWMLFRMKTITQRLINIFIKFRRQNCLRQWNR